MITFFPSPPKYLCYDSLLRKADFFHPPFVHAHGPLDNDKPPIRRLIRNIHNFHFYALKRKKKLTDKHHLAS
jgi:hypothetical protein